MVREVLTYPNKKLREVSKEVTEFDSELHTLLDDMTETMHDQSGIGLAAVQIGIPLRIIVIQIPESQEDDEDKNPLLKSKFEGKLFELINPALIEVDGKVTTSEGCLSVPHFRENVKRHKKIKLRYQDRNGKNYTVGSNDFLSVVIQHELDHLNGVLFIDKLSILKRKKFEKKYRDLKK